MRSIVVDDTLAWIVYLRSFVDVVVDVFVTSDVFTCISYVLYLDVYFEKYL